MSSPVERPPAHFAPGESLLDRVRREPALLCMLICALAALAAYAPRLLLLLESLRRDELLLYLTNRDFANYWLAGHMTLSGEQQDLFTQDVYFPRMQQVFGPHYPIHNWGYPPHLLLLLWPLGFVGFKTGLVLFLGVTLVLYIAALVLFRRVYAPKADTAVLVLAVLGYSVLMLDASQNGFLLAAVLLLGLAWKDQRPWLAGLAFGVLTVKPQMGFLLPVLLAFERNWKCIGWSAFFAILLIGLSALLFGLESWIAYLTETLAYQRFVMVGWTGIFLAMMPTVFGSVRTLGYTPDSAYLAQWPVSIGAALLTLWLFRNERDPLRRIFVLTCATFLISPYAFNYDMGALAAVAALLVGSQSFSTRGGILALAVVAGLPALVMNLGRSNVPIGPLLLTAALLTVALETRRATLARRPEPAGA